MSGKYLKRKFAALCVIWDCGLLWADAHAELPAIALSADRHGFVIEPTNQRFIAWGNNYAVDLMDRLARDPARVERDFAEMKTAGANLVRISPEMPAFFRGPDQIDPQAVRQLGKLLDIADKTGLYLHITGLACYRIDHRMKWYDAEEDSHRWNTQALFWQAVAEKCAGHASVFCYDLVNEAVPTGKPTDGWYMGRMGDFEFCQRLSLQPPKPTDDIFATWTRLMIASIRKVDQKHLITLGMLPLPDIYKSAAQQLDFVSPHIYPESKKVPDAIALLKKFNVGKPIEIGETFVLSCGVDDERTFLQQSRPLANGWLGHWPDLTPTSLRDLKKSGKIDTGQTIWLSWVDLFTAMAPEMTR